MNYAKKVMVCGFNGSAKTTLLRFLDGHPDLLGTQLYERFLNMFTYGKAEIDALAARKTANTRLDESHFKCSFLWNGKVIDINLYFFRTLLSKYSYYHVIEEEALNKATFNNFTSDRRDYFSFDFDFNKFENTWINALFKTDGVYAPEDIVDIFYKSFFDAWETYPIDYSPDKYIVFLGSVDPRQLNLLFDNNFNIKLIFVERDTEGVIFTKALRYKLSDKRKDIGYRYHLTNILYKKEAKRIGERRRLIHQLAKKHEAQFSIVNFEKFLCNPNETIDKIVKFLGIEHSNQLYIPTHLGKELKGAYAGKVNDDWRESLNKRDLAIIRYQAKEVRLADVLSKYGVMPFMEIMYLEISGIVKKIMSRLKRIYA